VKVVPVPGPSAVAVAASVSGFGADAFHFAGFLPRKPGKRRKALETLAALGVTLIVFESPHRVAATLADMLTVLGDRRLTVCRELTKLHEEVLRGSAAELAARYAGEPPKGEIVLVIGGAPERTGVDPAAVDAVRRLVESGARARVAAAVVAELTGGAANALYRAAQDL
jgi:16S rRNA (cytidine1402-2'-O)-methyltransferase